MVLWLRLSWSRPGEEVSRGAGAADGGYGGCCEAGAQFEMAQLPFGGFGIAPDSC